MKFRKGGMGTNILVFLIIFTFGLQAYCSYPAYMGSEGICPYSFSYGSIADGIKDSLFANVYTFAGAAVLIIGTFFFPNPYVIFFGVLVGVIGLASPVEINLCILDMCWKSSPGLVYFALGSQSGIPDPVMGLVRDVLIPCFIIAIVAWYAIRDVF